MNLSLKTTLVTLKIDSSRAFSRKAVWSSNHNFYSCSVNTDRDYGYASLNFEFRGYKSNRK